MKQYFIILCLVLINFYQVTFATDIELDNERVARYVQRVNRHLDQHAKAFAQLDGSAPFVMDWSEDLFLKPYLKEETILELNEQLSFLARHTDYRFFVLVTPALPYYASDLENLMVEIQQIENEFNQAVYTQSNLSQINGKKVVLLSLYRFEILLDQQVDWQSDVLSTGAVSISASGGLGETLKTKLLSYSQVWIHQFDYQKKKQHYLLRNKNFNGDGYISSLTKFIYKELPKPLIQRSYYLTYHGEIIELDVQKSHQDIAGNKEIYRLEVIEDSRMEAYADLLKRQKNYKEILNRSSNNENKEDNYHIKTQFNLVNEQLIVFDERVQEFKPVGHGLKEKAIVSEAICRQFVEWYRDDQFRGLVDRNDYTASPDDEHFEIGKNQVVYDRNLQGFEALSALLTPIGLDVVGDGLGLLYAGYYGDAYNTAFFIAAVAIPLANKTVLKAVVEGIQHVKKIGSNYQLVIKSDVLYSGLPVRFRQLLPSKILNKLEASEAKALLDKIKQAKFTDEVLTKLGKDLEADDLFELFKRDVQVVEAWEKMDQLGADEALRRNPGALDALSKTKGSRPDPSEYLDADYIANHLAKFDDGAVRFTSREAFSKYGTIGPDGGFIMPRSEFDKLLKETNKNLREVEKKLGLKEGYLGDDDTMVLLIEKQDLNGIRTPSGNEGGADPDLWIPGGKTSGGVSEAVMDFSGKPPFTEINIQ